LHQPLQNFQRHPNQQLPDVFDCPEITLLMALAFKKPPDPNKKNLMPDACPVFVFIQFKPLV